MTSADHTPSWDSTCPHSSPSSRRRTSSTAQASRIAAQHSNEFSAAHSDLNSETGCRPFCPSTDAHTHADRQIGRGQVRTATSRSWTIARLRGAREPSICSVVAAARSGNVLRPPRAISHLRRGAWIPVRPSHRGRRHPHVRRPTMNCVAFRKWRGVSGSAHIVLRTAVRASSLRCGGS